MEGLPVVVCMQHFGTYSDFKISPRWFPEALKANPSGRRQSYGAKDEKSTQPALREPDRLVNTCSYKFSWRGLILSFGPCTKRRPFARAPRPALRRSKRFRFGHQPLANQQLHVRRMVILPWPESGLQAMHSPSQLRRQLSKWISLRRWPHLDRLTGRVEKRCRVVREAQVASGNHK